MLLVHNILFYFLVDPFFEQTLIKISKLAIFILKLHESALIKQTSEERTMNFRIKD